MKLYTPSNTLLLDIEVDDTSVRYRSIMQDNNLTLNFSTVEPISIAVGSYCTFEGQRYTLYYPENFKKVNSRNFEYTLVLHSYQEALKLYKFKDLSAKPYRLKFPLTTRPYDFIKLLVDNLNQNYSGWSVGSYIDADEKVISFNHEYCYDVLNRIAQEFNTEWEIENKTIHLRKIEKFKDAPLALSYGKGNGFKSGVARQNDGDKQPIGKLYVQGGDRNIDYSEYGSSTLLLPKNATLEYQGKTYKTDVDGMYITRVGNNNVAEDSYDASSVYPKRVGTVSSVIIADAKQNFYDIIDTSIPANLNYRDCRIAGEKATIVFQSGALAGREFDILQTETDLTGYDHAQRKFEIVPQELDGMIMPSGVFIPKVGDKYAVFNISMPQAYISDNATQSGASWDMFKEAVKYFSEHEDARFTFRGELDGIWSKDKWLQIGGKITVGGHVLFSDNQFLPDGEVIRIVSIKDYVNAPFKPEITLSNAPVSGSFGSTLGKLEAEEVVIERNRKEGIQYTKRQWRDTKETMSMLQDSLLNFSNGINPITIQTMQLVAGDESLQFRFVNSKTAPIQVAHSVTFNKTNKQLTSSAGIIQHMTIGIDKISPTHKPSDYKFWDMAKYISPPLNENKPYYLYAKCSKANQSGTFILSTTAIELNSMSGYYHLLMGVINSEVDNDRSIGMLYGFSEITPARITTPVLASPDGEMYIDLLNKVIKGRIKFMSDGKENDLGDWAGGVNDEIKGVDEKIDNLEIGGVNLLANSNTSDTSMAFNRRYLSLYKGTIVGNLYTFSLRCDDVKTADFRIFDDTTISTGKYIGTLLRVGNTNVFAFTFKAIDAFRRIRLRDNNSSNATSDITTYDYQLEDGNKPTGYQRAPQDIQLEIDDAQQKAVNAQSLANTARNEVGNLNNYVDGAFADGIISEAEAMAIEKYLNSINEIMSKAEASYQKVYTNSYLEGTAKTALSNAKINLWGQRDTLISTIKSAISDGKTTVAEKNAVDNAFNTFNNLMSAFQSALEDANKAIQSKLDSISKGYVDGLEIGGVNLFTGTSDVITEAVNITTTLGATRNIMGDSQYIASVYIDSADSPTRIRIKQDLNDGGRIDTYSDYISSKGYLILPLNTSSRVNIVSLYLQKENEQSVVTYSKSQLEQGSKKTSYSPALEDTQQAIAKAQADASEVLAKTKGFTKIGGIEFDSGLIFTSLMKLLDAASGDEMAGISGIRGTLKDMPAVWSGGTYAEAIANIAKIILRHDGSGHLAGGNIGWDQDGNAKFKGKLEGVSGQFSGRLTQPFLGNASFDESLSVVSSLATSTTLPASADLNGGVVRIYAKDRGSMTVYIAGNRTFLQTNQTSFNITSGRYREFVCIVEGGSFVGWLPLPSADDNLILASGTVTLNGAQTNVCGIMSSSSGTSAITGGRRVPLSNLGHSKYNVLITPHTSTSSFRIGTKSQSSFEALGTGAFDYVVIGLSY